MPTRNDNDGTTEITYTEDSTIIILSKPVLLHVNKFIPTEYKDMMIHLNKIVLGTNIACKYFSAEN